MFPPFFPGFEPPHVTGTQVLVAVAASLALCDFVLWLQATFG